MRHGEEPVTLIAGSSSPGIGAAVAERLAHERHRLFLVGRDTTRLEHLGERLRAIAPSVWIHPGDSAKPRTIRHAVDDVLLHFGRLDNFVYVPPPGDSLPFLQEPVKDLEEQIRNNVEAPWLWMQAVIPQMLHNRRGRLVFMNHTAGVRGLRHMAAFSAAKHGLSGLIQAVAREYREEGIQPISLVLDGMLDHAGTREMYPEKEDWEDTIGMDAVADAVAHLLDQSGRGMTHEYRLTPGKSEW